MTMASIFDKMDKDVKKFLDMIDALLESDDDIKANSVDDIVKHIDRMKK